MWENQYQLDTLLLLEEAFAVPVLIKQKLYQFEPMLNPARIHLKDYHMN